MHDKIDKGGAKGTWERDYEVGGSLNRGCMYELDAGKETGFRHA